METGLDYYLRYLKGEEAALRGLVEQYWNSMLLFTNGYTHCLEDAEDIAQEALIKLSVKRPKFQHENQLKAYLFKICRNLALNHLKKNRRLQSLTPEITETLQDEIQDVEARMELEDTSRILHHAMLRLKQEHREILYLRYFEQLSIKEIAAIMKRSEKYITSLAYQARQTLKKILEKEGFHYENL